MIEAGLVPLVRPWAKPESGAASRVSPNPAPLLPGHRLVHLVRVAQPTANPRAATWLGFPHLVGRDDLRLALDGSLSYFGLYSAVT